MAYIRYNGMNVHSIYRKADTLPSKGQEGAKSQHEQLGQLASQESQAVRNPTRKNLVVLVPGNNNNIPDDIWEQIKRNPSVQGMIERGLIEEIKVPKATVKETIKVDAPVTGEKTDAPGSLEGMTVLEAIDWVHNTTHEKVLEKWADSETRPGVQSEIKAQLEKLAKITNGGSKGK